MKSLFITLLLALTTLAHAQVANAMFTKAEDLGKIKSGKLIIALDNFKDFDLNIKQAIESFWNYCPVEYKTISELESIKDSTIYFLIPMEVETTVTNSNGFIESSTLTSRLMLGSSMTYFISTKKNALDKGYIPFKKLLMNATASSYNYLSVAGSIKAMKDVVLYKTSTKDEKKALAEKQKVMYKVIKNKTVYFAEEDLKDKLTNEIVKELYLYPFKIVPREEIEKAVKEGKENIAFATIQPAGYKDLKTLYIKDAKTLENLAYVSTKNEKINKKDVKALYKFASKDE